ncbi:hypothetical protein LZ017_16990 [Pelomonas sp. CA6]|uniref:hypothetical protein n=1 Tax=Pelomonas sp. CA6 TaxID=2907999 RepID=UPI001F4C4BA0|nr:hypothetical protein [Pelomonas sp. CA6]MCH7345081.1 hypothetical protein [Pelomonas sp. CA6]
MNTIQRNALLNTTGGSSGTQGSGSWFEAMAEAWGKALDAKADQISDKSAQIGAAQADKPADITQLTAMSLEMGFLSNSSHTALASVGSALETMARKQ